MNRRMLSRWQTILLLHRILYGRCTHTKRDGEGVRERGREVGSLCNSEVQTSKQRTIIIFIQSRFHFHLMFWHSSHRTSVNQIRKICGLCRGVCVHYMLAFNVHWNAARFTGVSVASFSDQWKCVLVRMACTVEANRFAHDKNITRK